MAAATWRGLAIVDSRLWLRPDRRRGPRLRFEPGALVVAEPEGDHRLDWDRHHSASGQRPRWRCEGHAGSRAERACVLVVQDRPKASPLEFDTEVPWRVPCSWLSLAFAFEETAALVTYLAQTPAARPRLARPEAITRLLHDLALRPRFGRWPPGDHAMGDKLDVDLAIHRVFEAVGVRCFAGRPVAGEPLPQAPSLVGPVRRQLPRWVAPRVSDEQIEAQVSRFLNVRPWPFGALVDPH